MNMKFFIRYIKIVFIFFFGTVIAQNEVPAITYMSIQVNNENHFIMIHYDLYDTDDDSIQVGLKIFCNDSLYILTSSDSLAGDIGFPIKPGINKEIIWNYSKNLTVDGLNVYQLEMIADDLFYLDIKTAISEIDTNTVLDKLRIIEGTRHRLSDTTHLENTKKYIENMLLSCQLATERHSFPYDEYIASNIIGTKPGSEGNATIILNAHYDTVNNSPGADDNATGVVGVLEAARILSGYPFKQTIRFIASDLEEECYIGDKKYIDDVLSQNETILGVFNLDMIGYYSDKPFSQYVPFPEIVQGLYPKEFNEMVQNEFKGDFLFNLANMNSSELLGKYSRSAAQYVPELKVVSLTIPGYITNLFGGSDSYPFWRAGYSALMLSDGGGDSRNPYYHTKNDTVGTLHIPFLTNVIRSVVAATIELAEFSHFSTCLSEPFQIGNSSYLRFSNNNAIDFNLAQNYPNPFNLSTRISYTILKSSFITLKIVDVFGREIRTLVNEVQKADRYSVEFNANDLSSGIYFYKLQVANEFVETKKMILMK